MDDVAESAAFGSAMLVPSHTTATHDSGVVNMPAALHVVTTGPPVYPALQSKLKEVPTAWDCENVAHVWVAASHVLDAASPGLATVFWAVTDEPSQVTVPQLPDVVKPSWPHV